MNDSFIIGERHKKYYNTTKHQLFPIYMAAMMPKRARSS